VLAFIDRSDDPAAVPGSGQSRAGDGDQARVLDPRALVAHRAVLYRVALALCRSHHDAEDLVQALEAILPRDPRFIGLVGSRRHTGHHLEALREKGVGEEIIARIQSPVGLDLGAVTPGEIALSILAGLVAVRRGGGGGWKAKPSG